MADPAIDPYNPGTPGDPDAGGEPSGDAPRPPGLEAEAEAETETDAEEHGDSPGLEEQVDGLLAEVSNTVEDIQRKLSDDAPADYTDTDALEDELAAFADDVPDAEPDSEPSVAPASMPNNESEEDEEESTASGVRTAVDDEASSTDVPASDQTETAGVEDAEPEPEPIAADIEIGDDAGDQAAPDMLDDVQAALEDAVGSADQPSAPDSRDDEPRSAHGRAPVDQVLLKDDDQNTDAARTAGASNPIEGYNDAASLDDELALLAGDTPGNDNAPAGEDEDHRPGADADAEDPASEPSIPGSADEIGAADADVPPDYTDADSLDDELAALAADALGDATNEEPDDSDGSDPDADLEPEQPAEADAEPVASPDEAQQPAVDAEPVAADAPVPVGVAAHTMPAEQVGMTADEPSQSRDGLRRGWLPPKPDWPEIYSRWRPLVIAWRHIAWIVPPLVVHLWRTAWAWLAPRAKESAVKAEPHIRMAVARIATPLSRRDERTRSIMGWFAIYTLFVSACLWVYILVGRAPVAPEPTTPATGLARETTTANADD